MIDTTATPIVIGATRVSYTDQANPLKAGTIVGSTSSAWGTQYAVLWDNATGDVLDYSDLRQAGWQHLGTPYRVGIAGSDPAALELEGEADEDYFDEEPTPAAFCDSYTAHDAHLYRALNGNTYACPGMGADELAALEEEANRPACEHGLSASLCAGPGHYPADR